jgi:hypothetical protein
VKEWRVTLPAGVRSPFEVYVNGVRQELGSDYRVAEGELLFERELVRQKLSLWASGGSGRISATMRSTCAMRWTGDPWSPAR